MIQEHEAIFEKLNVEKDKYSEYKEIINKFFDRIFKYNPEVNVRSSYQSKIKDDPYREDVSEE